MKLEAVFELESPRILSLHSVIIEFPFWKDVIWYAHIPDLKYKGTYLLRPYIGKRYTIPCIYAKVYSSIGLKLTISFLQQHEYFKYQGVKNHFGGSLVSISPHVKFLTERSKNSKKFGEKTGPKPIRYLLGALTLPLFYSVAPWLIHCTFALQRRCGILCCMLGIIRRMNMTSHLWITIYTYYLSIIFFALCVCIGEWEGRSKLLTIT